MNMDQDNNPEAGENLPETSGLDALEGEAVRLDPPKLAPGEEPPPQPLTVAEQTAQNVQFVELIWSLAGPMLAERYAERYGEAQLRNVAEKWTLLERRRGWSVGGFMEKWAPELALGMAVLAPVVPVLMHDLKNMKGARHERDQ